MTCIFKLGLKKQSPCGGQRLQRGPSSLVLSWALGKKLNLGVARIEAGEEVSEAIGLDRPSQ
jgi:hypothetical protein